MVFTSQHNGITLNKAFFCDEQETAASIVSGFSSTADEDIPVSIGGYSKDSTALATDTLGNLWTVYSYYNTTYYLLDLLKSEDDGESWTQMVYIYDSTRELLNPDIAIDLSNNYVYVVYEVEESATPSSHDIMLFRYNQWDIISVDTDTYNQRNPAIAIDPNYGDSNYMYIAYEQLASYDDRSMIVKRSINDGESWSAWHYSSTTSVVHTHMDIAVDFSGTVYLTYAYGTDYSNLNRIVVEYGSRSGIFNAFENKATAYTSPESKTVNYPSIAVSRDSSMSSTIVAVVFEYHYSASDYDIGTVYSYDGGSTWHVTGISETTDWEGHPCIVADGMDSTGNSQGNFYVTYIRETGFTIVKAPFSNLSAWTTLQTYHGTKNLPVQSSRVFGMTTLSDHTLFVSYEADNQIYLAINHEEMKLITPVAGTTLTVGDAFQIEWSWNRDYSDVNLELYKDSTFILTIASSTENDGLYVWTVADVTAGSNYQVKIKPSGYSTPFDFSEIFTIENTDVSITVTTPDENTQWTAGTLETITWTWTGSISLINIWLYKGLGETGEVLGYIAQNTANTGSYSWGIPADLDPGTDYWLEVEDSGSDAHGFSPLFTIEAAEISSDPSIFITSPTKVSAWRPGAVYTISWNSQYNLGQVTISLLKGQDLVYLISEVEGSANYDWVIPSDTVPGTDYRIFIVVTNNTDLWGMSDEFRILEPGTTTDTGVDFSTTGLEHLLVIAGMVVFALKRKKSHRK